MRFFLGALFLLFSTLVFADAGVNISPIFILLDQDQKDSSFIMTNNNTTTKVFKISIFDWTQTEDQEAVLTADDGVVIYPPIVTLKPGQDKNIRIYFKNKKAGFYKINLLELEPTVTKQPDVKNDGRVKITTLFNLYMPVLTMYPDKRRDLKVEFKTNNNQCILHAENNAINVETLIGVSYIQKNEQLSFKIFHTVLPKNSQNIDLPNYICSNDPHPIWMNDKLDKDKAK